uniref:TctD transcriptional regulator n=1 Tax=Polysiphonia urceolata TaxID=173545 RepID=A0A1Z1MCA3_POLUR|nr:hypothetical protein [Polysiphonia stricta]ARW63610.1 hypothetical protein [Polysiphonia stricta]
MKKILLLDDDQNLCNLLSSYLVAFNFSVNYVHSVPAALANIRNDSPDLVISDIMMKDLNGYDFIRLLKLDKAFIHIPVIFLTAKGMTYDKIKGYNLGCHAYLTKPFNPEELNAIINSIFYNINLLHRTITNSASNEKVIINDSIINSCHFTYREASVLHLVLKGYMNKEIAISLNVSSRNVEKYITRLLSKTNARNRVELIKLCLGFN